ncbi:MAG: formate dehydrogenase subunit alpha [Candidatus Adiutrix intracellularis]|jgi:formate dehydrogenase major subunit|nr:MAG: formate dehydrogenase subunit alpha [Candidatus Adiutrix intracellularis]MDR2827180.1 formate dehydrogenase subunit alpha [Candidatus Adiutrix intracellularis]
MVDSVKEIQTTCCYCGAGCQLLFTVDQKANQILDVHPVNGRTNAGKACLKGWYGWDYLNDPQILTKRLREPMIRKDGKKSPLKIVTWDEAINFVADNFKKIKEKWGPNSFLAAASARGPGNEAGYITQKFARAVIGTNNIDHCARICHAASVVGSMQTIGEGAMSLSIPEIEDCEIIFNIGYNAPVSHPIVARRIVRAKEKGAYIICADPRITETARIADKHLQLKGGTNVALVNAMAHVIISEDLLDHEFVKAHTKGFDEFWAIVKEDTPERSAEICGLTADDIRLAARKYASSKHSVITWGMGITQFSQGVETVKCCCSLAMLTGNFGHYACGTGPVRGQNNVQGTCDMGDLPNVYPGYQSVTDPAAQAKFEKAWGVKLDNKVGIQLTRIPEFVIHEKNPANRIHAYYITGEDPAQSDPDLEELRESLDEIDFVVCQDIFWNKTCLHADAILPSTSWGEHDGVYTSSDRGFQRIRKVLEPIGNILPDWEITCRIARAMGYPMPHYRNTEEIWNEVIDLSPKFTGATYEKLEKYVSIQWPCWDKGWTDKGTMFLHKDGYFATPDGIGILKTSPYHPPAEVESKDYPITLCTVREVGHYSVRTMTGNCRTLRNLEDEPGWVEISPEDARELGLKHEELVRISSKRGSVITRASITERVKKGAVYMTYQWWVGACNELTISILDPSSKTPEYKYCACKIEKLPDQKAAWAAVNKTLLDIRMNMHIDITRQGVSA